jgi:hypothetical protein
MEGKAQYEACGKLKVLAEEESMALLASKGRSQAKKTTIRAGEGRVMASSILAVLLHYLLR